LHDETIGTWLDQLASEAPAPGGGAVAAMSAAMSGALISMACNLTIGKPRYAQHEAALIEVRDRATELRSTAVALADQDAEMFERVIAAYRMPKGDDAERGARNAAIEAALIDAADVPMRTAALAVELIDRCRQILDQVNVNLVSDVGVAASCARTALEAAATNVRVNQASIADDAVRARLGEQITAHLRHCEDADWVVNAVTKRVSA
jgi:formiminotetrahydrofolate cyclodeaminase